ncbi:long-chain-fatty-acid--CoA ligase [Frankia sp. AgKG'84/4]|uniref:long-chain-fatty-acid--CoA ligase n=1 Tax=Frankia sp. AgKG'84/4 TaxID=573490 RepID=UPI00200E1D61|nr:long-chain fatty acid--CoA ligase [Frankia sp. AgKG'84/4]MCL9794696.1 long-chain fatty acid--CoA ligase [Frankia sp. AgKG'84/4]
MLNLAVVLETAARQTPQRSALVAGDRRLSYREVDDAANRLASALAARGVGPGDRIALGCPNIPAFVVVYFGILKTGATVVPLNILLTAKEISHQLADSAAKVYFCFEGTAGLPAGEAGRAAFAAVPSCATFVLVTADPAGVSPWPDVPTLAEFTRDAPAEFDTVPTEPNDVAVVLYTSGTTGRPKGAQLSHSNLVQNALVCLQVFRTLEPDIHLVCLPLFHAFAQTIHLLAGCASGSTLVLLARFDPEDALAWLERADVTFFAGVPTMYWSLFTCSSVERFDLARIADNLRICVSGGSALPVGLLRDFEERFGVPIVEGYGLSETSPLATFNRLDRPRKPGSVGLPAWGVQVRIVGEDGRDVAAGEPGEVQVRGHNVMVGYLGQPAATAAAIDAHGWFRTGDIGRLDSDGFLYLIDRLKDMVIRGGYNVYPREVEEILLTHPDISLVAVVGIPDERHGQEVKAFVIAREGTAPTEEEIVAWCRENMAAYKYPRVVEFRASFPMTAAGKILKRELVRTSPDT